MAGKTSWLQALQEQEKSAAQAGQFRRKTYVLDPETERRLMEEAERREVGVNELLRALHAWLIEELAAGRVEVRVDRTAVVKPGPGRPRGSAVTGVKYRVEEPGAQVTAIEVQGVGPGPAQPGREGSAKRKRATE